MIEDGEQISEAIKASLRLDASNQPQKSRM